MLSAILAFILNNGTLMAIVGAVVAALGYGFQQRRAGAKAEKAKQAAQEQKARDIRDEVQNDIGALPADEARKELGTWDR